MSTSIQAVLALLPELFPGTQQIPLGRIRPYPDNPGPPVTEDQVQELTEPILEDGLVNPLKLRPDPANPLAPGLSPHPDNPRMKADGTPWGAEDFNWMILSGERRWRAFNKLQEAGWAWQGGSSAGHQATYRLTQGPQAAGQAFIPAFILNPTQEEAVIITHTDNDVRDRGWFAAYQSIEALIKANPSLTQGQVGTRLKLNRKKVNRAIRLLPLLNPEARALISANSTNSADPGGAISANGTNQTKKNKGISEIAASWLADLGPGTGLKPGVRKKRAAGEAGSPMDPAHPSHGPQLEASAQGDAQRLWPYPAIPAETQELVYRTLKEACDQGLTEAGVKGLVDWVKGGHNPEDFDTSMAPLKKASALRPQAEGQDLSVPIPGEQGIGKGNEPGDYDPAKAKAVEPPRHQGHQERQAHLGGSPKAQATSTPTPASEDVHAEIGSWIAMGQLNKKAHLPRGVANRLLPAFTRLFGKLIGLFEAMGVKNKVTAAILAFFLVMFLGSTVLGHTRRLLGRLVDSWIYPRIATNQQAQTTPIEPPSRQDAKVGQILGAAKMSAAVKATSIHKRNLGQSKPNPVTANPNLAQWAESDKPLALEVARHFYEVTGLNFDDEKKYFKTAVTGDYYPVFVEKYFPLSRQTELSQNRQVTYFKPTGEVKLLGVTENTDSFRVEGVQTTVSRLNPRQNKYLGDKPVALVVRLRHTAGFKPLADQVGEATPEMAKASAANNIHQDQLNGFAGTQGKLPAKGSTVDTVLNDAAHAVNAAGDALTAGAEVKRQLGI